MPAETNLAVASSKASEALKRLRKALTELRSNGGVAEAEQQAVSLTAPAAVSSPGYEGSEVVVPGQRSCSDCVLEAEVMQPGYIASASKEQPKQQLEALLAMSLHEKALQLYLQLEVPSQHWISSSAAPPLTPPPPHASSFTTPAPRPCPSSPPRSPDATSAIHMDLRAGSASSSGSSSGSGAPECNRPSADRRLQRPAPHTIAMSTMTSPLPLHTASGPKLDPTVASTPWQLPRPGSLGCSQLQGPRQQLLHWAAQQLAQQLPDCSLLALHTTQLLARSTSSQATPQPSSPRPSPLVGSGREASSREGQGGRQARRGAVGCDPAAPQPAAPPANGKASSRAALAGSAQETAGQGSDPLSWWSCCAHPAPATAPAAGCASASGPSCLTLPVLVSALYHLSPSAEQAWSCLVRYLWHPLALPCGHAQPPKDFATAPWPPSAFPSRATELRKRLQAALTHQVQDPAQAGEQQRRQAQFLQYAEQALPRSHLQMVGQQLLWHAAQVLPALSSLPEPVPAYVLSALYSKPWAEAVQQGLQALLSSATTTSAAASAEPAAPHAPGQTSGVELRAPWLPLTKASVRQRAFLSLVDPAAPSLPDPGPGTACVLLEGLQAIMCDIQNFEAGFRWLLGDTASSHKVLPEVADVLQQLQPKLQAAVDQQLSSPVHSLLAEAVPGHEVLELAVDSRCWPSEGCTPPQPSGASTLRPGSGSGQEGSARDERSERDRPLLLGRVPYQVLSYLWSHLQQLGTYLPHVQHLVAKGVLAGMALLLDHLRVGSLGMREPTADGPQLLLLHLSAASCVQRQLAALVKQLAGQPDQQESAATDGTTSLTTALQKQADELSQRLQQLLRRTYQEGAHTLLVAHVNSLDWTSFRRPLKNSQAASATPRVWRCALHRLLHCAASTIAPCATEALLAQVLLDTLPVIVQCYQSLSPSRQRLPQFIADVAHLSSTVHCLTQPFTSPLPHNNSTRHIHSSITEVEILFQLPLAAVQQLSMTVRQLCLHAGLLQLPADEMGLLVASAAGLQAGAACSSVNMLQPGPMPDYDNLRHPDQDSGVSIPPPFTRPSSTTTRVVQQEESPRSLASSATELPMPCSQPINAMQRPVSSVRPALSCGGMPRSSTHNDPGTNTNGERRLLPPLRRGSWVQALRNMPPPPPPYCSLQDASGKEPHGYLTEGDLKASLLVGSHGLPGSVPFSSGLELTPLATDHLPIVVQQPWAQADHAIHLEDVWRCPRGLWAGPSRTLAPCRVSDSMALQHSDNPPWSWLTSSIAQQLAGQPLGPNRYFNPLAHMDCTNILVSGAMSAMWRNVLSNLARNARPCEVLHAIYKRSELHEEVTGLPMDDQERNDRGALRAIASYAMLRH